MAIFDRIRRNKAAHAAPAHERIPAHLLPEVNQRVTVTRGEHVPMPSRVEDINGATITLALPALPLDDGDSVVVTWERDDAWFSMDTSVIGVDDGASVPTMHITAHARLSRFDERRSDVRRAIELPLELRIVRSRAIRPGRELRTTTIEVSNNAMRFATTAPFAPGDLIEAKVALGDGEEVGARIRIIRVDAVSGSWRSTCTATFDEVLRSDRSRLLAHAAAHGAEARPAQQQPTLDESPQVASTPTTADGVGGRDAPVDLGTLDNVVEWLRRND
ncbi:MAG: hypothetical protein JWM86_1517 [Thermoleophilia bacterium]|nr:hypothetical protein [Thermoleophilia bacterium]